MNRWGVRNVPIEVVEWGCYEKSREILAGRVHKREAYHVREMHRAIVEKRQSKKVKRMPIQKSLDTEQVSMPVEPGIPGPLATNA
ncbi:MAG: hypothetical protein HKN23_21810 [Verrucomicrobiales bacterium]|nr:hypothetical protein [Verrucomicrobiales bacterium]